MFAYELSRGLGRKFGEGIQFATTAIGGTAYAFYASWKVSLVVLAVVPLMAVSSVFVVTVTTKQTERANQNYKETGGIVYSTISAIRTVFSLNACETMIHKFEEATLKAYKSAVSFTLWSGLANGGVMASFLVSYIALTLYGSYLMYDDVKESGCDPSNAVPDAQSCSVVGAEVFGALMGISFGAMGLAQVSAAVEAFTAARAACHPALLCINRKLGATDSDNIDIEKNDDSESLDAKKEMPLPKYVIDSSSDEGLKPSITKGEIVFQDVTFSYPTRPDSQIFNQFSLKVQAGKTVALVGPSGGGKSTFVSLMERFYDPTAGSITLDGHDLRDLNVHWLRDQIGLVSQEPTLFARTIRENIAYGFSGGVTEEQIIQAAKAANAHDFIMSFPDGYDTFVGDKGAQLSGGQKQRIAIARVLLKNPKILLLDEATSALDSESEYVVQQALDSILGSGARTTIVIAHRLSTIRNADLIAVVKGGKVVETGSHDELITMEDSEYGKLVAAQSTSKTPSRTSSLANFLPSFKTSHVMNVNTEALSSPQLVFQDVHFAYPNRPDAKVLNGLNLEIRNGETIALVGQSGGGKSTVISMIERFYDPSSGSITFEGDNIKDLNIKSLRNQVGVVSQEPTLFNASIRENIRMGFPSATQEDIEYAAKQANAHDFITSFENGYNTQVGEGGLQVSGGQKQRIAIARAIIKKPKLLLLDEATSALDSESERIVQEALDRLLESKTQTVLVIAHRLSTVRNADRIAVIDNGRIKEIGTHEELMAIPDGHYKRLQEFQSLSSSKADIKMITTEKNKQEEVKKEEKLENGNVKVSDKISKVHASRARLLAKDDLGLFAIGSFGAILAGLVFPGWGIVFAYMIELLFRIVLPCENGNVPFDFTTCEMYWDHEASYMRDLSFKVTYGWLGLIGATLIGNSLLYYGFGTATERMNKRVRDAIFTSLMRQDIAFYDKNTVGNLSSQIEDDAAKIHSFSGEPIRTFMMSAASVLVGLVISFVYMWPFALLTLVVLPFLSFGAYMEMQMYMGTDEEDSSKKEGENSPGAIVVETLLNMRTVASLTIEKSRRLEYAQALKRGNPASFTKNLIKGSFTGFGFVTQTWGMGFLFWWGGYVLNRWPGLFTYRSYLISMFSLLFSLSGLSMAFMGATDQDAAKAAADRIFSIIDRESDIDSLSDEGKKIA